MVKPDAAHSQPTTAQLNNWLATHSPFHRFLGIVIEQVDARQATCSMALQPDFYHAGGVLHGGITYSLADSTVGMLLACNLGTQRTFFTIEGKLNYLASLPAGTTGTITSTAKAVAIGRTTAVADVDVYSPNKRLLCHGLFTYAIR